MRRSTSLRLAAAAALMITVPSVVSACGNAEEEEAAGSTPQAESTTQSVASTTTSKASETTTTQKSSVSVTRSLVTYTPSGSASMSAEAAESSEPATASVTETSTQAASASADAQLELNEAVTEAYDIFSDLAPRALFAQFTDCTPAGLEDSYNCSGPGVGQVQFFKSKNKAAQTTQVLTELRSSRVLSDDGNVIIGWSTLGSTAVLTAVDNSKGLVIQQMVSTGQEDPERKLQNMGLLPTA